MIVTSLSLLKSIKSIPQYCNSTDHFFCSNVGEGVVMSQLSDAESTGSI